jgi:hypothetical protein
MPVLALMALAAGCEAPPCRYGTEEAKVMTQDPKKLLAYFIDQILCGQLAAAHEHGLSRETKQQIDYNAFYLGLTHEQNGIKPLELDVTRRLLGGLRQEDLIVDGNRARASWSNPEFGFLHPVRLVHQRVGRKTFWYFDFTREELEQFMKVAVDASLAWFRRQRQVADGRLYTYPRDWQYTPR